MGDYRETAFLFKQRQDQVPWTHVVKGVTFKAGDMSSAKDLMLLCY